MSKKKKRLYFIEEILFFLKIFLIAGVLYYPPKLNRFFKKTIVASILLKKQNKEYRLLKKIEEKTVTYFIEQKIVNRSLASKNKPLKDKIFFRKKISAKVFNKKFNKIKNLIWTLKYQKPNFQLDKCKKIIAHLQTDANTSVDICFLRPRGLKRLAALLKNNL